MAQTLAVAMAVILTFWGTWSKLFSQWSRSDDYAYGMMIPPICLLLVWERRKALAALALRADLRGLLLMLFAVILFGLGELGAELFTTRAAVITLFIGALWWMHGRAVVRTLALPLLLLYFMLPLPGFVYRSITFPLQIMASTISVHLLNDVPLEDVIIWPGIDKLSFISGGVATVSEAEALGSSRMKSLVDEMKSRYADRIVLLDTPPVLSGADTLALVPLVDCIILVVAEGRTNMKDVFKSLEVLPEKKLLGFVMNRQKEADTSYPYYYR